MPKAFISSDGLEKLVENIKNSSGGGGSIPYTNHNGGIRGKNLGSTFTAEQKAAIADGSFNDLYVGDYWLIDNIKYVIVDIDYYMNYGNPTPTTQHHLIVLPSDDLSQQGYVYDSNYYGNSSIYTTYLPDIASSLETIFGAYLINQYIVLYNNNGVFWGQAKCILPSILQIDGYCHDIQYDKQQRKCKQFSYFRYDSTIAATSNRTWLRDSNCDGKTMFYAPEGAAGLQLNSFQYYLRPYFILSGTEQSST